MLATAYDPGEGAYDPETPSGYASTLAKSITDPSTIRAHTLSYFGKAPSVETIRRMIDGHRAKRARHFTTRTDASMHYNEDNDSGHWAVRVTDKKRERDYLDIPPPPPKNPFLQRWRIAGAVAESVGEAFGVEPVQIMGKFRTRKHTHPRSVVYKLLIDWGLGYAEIGRRMGDRDHSTIVHGVNNTFPVAMRDEKARAIYAKHTALIAEAIEAMKAQEDA